MSKWVRTHSEKCARGLHIPIELCKLINHQWQSDSLFPSQSWWYVCYKIAMIWNWMKWRTCAVLHVLSGTWWLLHLEEFWSNLVKYRKRVILSKLLSMYSMVTTFRGYADDFMISVSWEGKLSSHWKIRSLWNPRADTKLINISPTVNCTSVPRNIVVITFIRLGLNDGKYSVTWRKFKRLKQWNPYCGLDLLTKKYMNLHALQHSSTCSVPSVSFLQKWQFFNGK